MLCVRPARTSVCLRRPPRRLLSDKSIQLRGGQYPIDDWSNVTPAILSKLNSRVSPLTVSNHPLAILKKCIERALPDFKSITINNPIVSVAQNFDELAFPVNHPGRSRTDLYYVNKEWM